MEAVEDVVRNVWKLSKNPQFSQNTTDLNEVDSIAFFFEPHFNYTYGIKSFTINTICCKRAIEALALQVSLLLR